MTNNEELVKEIPKTAREFRFDNMLLKITTSKNGTYGFLIKNHEKPKYHYTLVAEEENPSFHYTKESGLYTHQFYKKLKFSPAVSNSNMGSTVVVDKFSKAVDENGVCKNDNLRYLIKHDYSTVACVSSETAWKLIGRGWGI